MFLKILLVIIKQSTQQHNLSNNPLIACSFYLPSQRLVEIHIGNWLRRVLTHINYTIDGVAATLARAARIAAVIEGHAVGAGLARFGVLVGLLHRSQHLAIAVVGSTIPPIDVPPVYIVVNSKFIIGCQEMNK